MSNLGKRLKEVCSWRSKLSADEHFGLPASRDRKQDVMATIAKAVGSRYLFRMKKCLVVAAVLAALLSIGEVSLAKSDVLEATELYGWYFRSDDALAFYDLDGGARTTFFMKLNDGQIAIASFSWAVQPGARPSSSKTVLVVDGKLKESKSHLLYDLQSISGTISTSQSVYSVEVAKSEIKRIEIWSRKSRQYIFSEFDKLMAPLPLKVVKPLP